MKAEKLLPLEAIKIGLDAKSKKEAIIKMIELAAKTGKIKDIAKVRAEVLEREKLASTGIGNGIALPHAKTSYIETMFAAFATLKTPIDFDAIDAKPVKMIFLLLSTEGNIGNQLRHLSMYSRILNIPENCEKIMNCETETELFEFFSNIEEED
jgi:mannitol/fructose-specific phosphotransferase system IIA component (Ntr-type)